MHSFLNFIVLKMISVQGTQKKLLLIEVETLEPDLSLGIG